MYRRWAYSLVSAPTKRATTGGPKKAVFPTGGLASGPGCSATEPVATEPVATVQADDIGIYLIGGLPMGVSWAF
jgi:hypothetical protein